MEHKSYSSLNIEIVDYCHMAERGKYEFENKLFESWEWVYQVG